MTPLELWHPVTSLEQSLPAAAAATLNTLPSSPYLRLLQESSLKYKHNIAGG